MSKARAQSTSPVFTLADFTNRMTIFAYSALSPNGRKLAYISNLTGEPQIWIGDIAPESKQMLYPRPLTTGKKELPLVIHPGLAWIDDDRLISLMDEQGDEQTFIRLFNLKTGEQKDLERGQGRDYLGFISKDKKTLYFTSNRKSESGQSLFSYDIMNEKTNLEHESTDGKNMEWANVFLGKDKSLVSKGFSNSENHLYIFDHKTKKMELLFGESNTTIGPIHLLNSKELLVTTNYGRQFLSLAKLDLKNKKITFIEKDQWDIEITEVSPDKKSLFVSRNVGGKNVLEHYSLPNLKKQKVKFFNQGVIANIHITKDSKTLVLGYQSPTEPKNYYRLDLKKKTCHRLTNNWTSRVPEKVLSMPVSVQFESNGKSIQSWFYTPHGAKKNKSLPVIFWPHGGPQWQEKAQFRAMLQYFIYKGFAVWCPNPTGSTGFGIDFTEAICGQWGTADLPDVINGIEWLKNSGWINPNKIVVMGGSYGGYMTLRAITKIPNTFKAAVDIFGVSNLLTFVKTVPKDWLSYMDKMVGNAERDRDKLIEQSPFFYLDKVDCPLLVIQGAKDPRVVKAESDQVVEKLKTLGKTVEYLVFEDEGHGFFRPENELKAYQTAADFITKHIEK